MDYDYSLEIEKEVMEESRNYIQSIINDIMLIFLQAITLAVYRYENAGANFPTVYRRKYQLLLSSLNYIMDDNNLYVFIDASALNYHSNVTGEDVSEHVPYWVEDGHHDDTGIQNQYHNYEGRKYLELARDMIEAKYGIVVQIIK